MIMINVYCTNNTHLSSVVIIMSVLTEDKINHMNKRKYEDKVHCIHNALMWLAMEI